MVPGSLTQDAQALYEPALGEDALIRLANIHVSYSLARGASKKVLNGINLTIRRGEFVALAGQTGCGKSTLLRLVLGAETPSTGSVLVDGREVVRPDRDRGYVPQKYSLFPDKTVLENITFGPEVEEFSLLTRLTPRFYQRRRKFRGEALHQLRRMGLHDSDAAKYPDQLSGGMQQRVAIAQALVMKPKILLMDEAFSALDPGTRASMQKLIRRVWAETGMTILFVTHNIAEAVRLGTRVVVLAKDEQARAGEGSGVSHDIPVPAWEQIPDALRPQEFARMVESVEEATGYSSSEDGEAGTG
ncbi:MAG TPA: ABC transporter ATP-binding protein [Bryobacteraceae bacterium]|nr:ABC transporter ATP-binding protein [Bryobacteraceae bacterium]